MVLENAISGDLNDEEKIKVTHHFRHTSSIIDVLFAPLLVVGLGHLLNIETEEIEQTLIDLKKVIMHHIMSGGYEHYRQNTRGDDHDDKTGKLDRCK